jgi:UDP-glucuronate 4-epimerase
MDFIHEIEHNLGIEADKNMMPIQPGDVPKTWADVDNLFELTDFKPQVSVKEGVKNFIDWYKEYYNVN